MKDIATSIDSGDGHDWTGRRHAVCSRQYVLLMRGQVCC